MTLYSEHHGTTYQHSGMRAALMILVISLSIAPGFASAGSASRWGVNDPEADLMVDKCSVEISNYLNGPNGTLNVPNSWDIYIRNESIPKWLKKISNTSIDNLRQEEPGVIENIEYYRKIDPNWSNETLNINIMILCFSRAKINSSNKSRVLSSTPQLAATPQIQNDSDAELEHQQRRNQQLVNAMNRDESEAQKREREKEENYARGMEKLDLKEANDSLAQAREMAKYEQERLEARRKWKPKRHHEELEASHCLSLRRDKAWGGFNNTCPHEVTYVFCTYKPKNESWAAEFDCEKKQFGMDSLGIGGSAPQHTNGAQRVYWAACKFPEGLPAEVEFTAGAGIAFRCASNGYSDYEE